MEEKEKQKMLKQMGDSDSDDEELFGYEFE